MLPRGAYIFFILRQLAHNNKTPHFIGYKILQLDQDIDVREV